MTDTKFSDLSLSPALLNAVTEMGFITATSIQVEAIPAIRAGSDVLARSQTGTGKTVAFGIPAVECVDVDDRCVQVLVLSPTRELAQQCGDEIRKLSKYIPKFKAADIFGGADYRGQFKNLETANLIIGTPGRIMDHMRRGSLDLSRLKMVVLDEADEMLNMGFREDIEVILQDVPEERQIILFSATVPNEILSITRQFQKNPVRIDINREKPTLDNITQLYAEVPLRHKADALLMLLHYYQPVRSIIFCNTKSMVDELTEQLSAGGFSVEGLHGDMKQLQRTTVMNGFKRGRISILVATDVAARGIDVSDIEYVFNYDIPKVSDYYIHRIGRTGRAGRSGTALTLCCGRQQLMQVQRLAKQSKSGISAIPIPTVEDIETANYSRTLASVEEKLSAEPQTRYVEMVAQLVERGHAPETIAAMLLALSFQSDTKALRNLPRSTVTSLGSALHSEKAAVGKKLKFRGEQGMAELVINTGSANRVAPNHIVGALTEKTGISSRELGKIQIFESFSTVAVPAAMLDEIIVAAHGCKICGKPVQIIPMDQPKRKPGVKANGFSERKTAKPGGMPDRFQRKKARSSHQY